MSKLLLIDGTALVFRGFYGIRHLALLDGKPVNAIYGFYLILLNLLLEENPEYFSICFDRSETTSRKKEYPAYKATRKSTPSELLDQIPIIKDILINGKLNLNEKAGVEADDLIATIAKQHEGNSNLNTFVYSSDLDLMQLVNQNTTIIKPGNSKVGNTHFDPSAVEKKYGFTSDKIPDYKGLHGDSSDNLPGVKGVGTKTATKLIQDFGSLENIYQNLDQITGSLHQKLVQDKEQAFLCKKLATLHTNIDMPLDLETFNIHNINFAPIQEKFQTLQFASLSKKLQRLQDKLIQQKHQNQQATLF